MICQLRLRNALKVNSALSTLALTRSSDPKMTVVTKFLQVTKHASWLILALVGQPAAQLAGQFDPFWVVSSFIRLLSFLAFFTVLNGRLHGWFVSTCGFR